METRRYLLDYEVEAHGCLDDNVAVIKSLHPSQEYEINISNLNIAPGVSRPLLSVQLILSAQTINLAEEKGANYILEYLNILVIVTNLAFRVHKLIRVIDWTIGIKERESIQYESFPGAQLPYAEIKNEHFGTVELLLNSNLDSKIKRSLSWFSSGVEARYIEDQFQFFWFVIEIMAGYYKETTKVNDLCVKCRSPLYCENCDIYPSHRPYPKQAIKQLIMKFAKNEPQVLFEHTNQVRNCLMHGDTTALIEESLQISLSDIVNELGQVAWKALFNAIMQSLKVNTVQKKFPVLATNIYTNKFIEARIKLKVYSKDPNNPLLEELSKPDVNLVAPDGRNADKN